jgi:hypothetical protein
VLALKTNLYFFQKLSLGLISTMGSGNEPASQLLGTITWEFLFVKFKKVAGFNL